MTVSVNLWSDKAGEVKRFLDSFYEKDVGMDDDVDQWIYVYNKPLSAIDIISAAMDNNDKYRLSMAIQVDDCDVHHVTTDNHNNIIKGLVYLHYQETETASC